MPRKKRSEKIREAARPIERPERKAAAPVVAGETFAALCPVCGRAIPEGRAVRIGGITVGKTPYFDTIEWDPNKPFGVALSAGGRGSFREWRHIGPEELPEMFDQVRGRLLDAVKEYYNKGWLTDNDLKALIH